MRSLVLDAVALASGTLLFGWAADAKPPADYDGIVRRVAAADAERAARQAKLARRASLEDYRDRVVRPGGTNVWTRALQAALDANEIVVIPASGEPYWIDGVVRIPSGRRIEAKGATVALLPGVRTLMLRNANCPDGTLKPVAGRRDDNIAVVGGRWEDWTRKRAGYGATGRFDMSERRHGNWFGVSTLFYFGNCDHVTVEGVTFAHTSGFAVQSGDGDAHGYADIAFDDCYADGLHLNGNLTRVHAKNVRGKVGDDLVALNAYDWLNSSVNFGPQKDILCEDLELILKDGKGYPAIRIQPAKYKYADGSVVDCAVSDVIFRRVKGIVTFKMYLQTPGYTLDKSPEWAEVGSGGNLWFEDIEIDLTHPIDNFGQYATSDPLRGHFGAFEFGANLTSVNFRNIDIRFHLDKWPLAHLAVVGPKSLRLDNYEVFDPYVSCRVGRVTIEGLTVRGRCPEELVRATVFDDVNGDGRSSGRGVIDSTMVASGSTARATVGRTSSAEHSPKDEHYLLHNENKFGTIYSSLKRNGAMIMAGKLEDRVKDIIVEQLGVNAEQVTSEASFIDDLGADSLDSVELIMAFEEEFGAAIPEEDAEKLTTVGKVVEYLKSKGYGEEGAASAQ